MTQRPEMRLLVLDDGLEFCALLEEYSDLCRHQFKVSCRFAKTLSEVKEASVEWHPSMVLIDAHTEAADSFEVLDWFRDSESAVVLTSETMSREIEVSAKQRGASGYLPKTVNPDEMEGFLQRLVTMTDASQR